MSAVCGNVELAGPDDVEAVAFVAGPNHELSRRDLERHEAQRDAFFCRDRERCEHRYAVDEVEPGGGCERSVYLREPAVREQRQTRQDRADDNEGGPRSDCPDDDRRRHRSERDAAHCKSPNQAEHAGEHLVRNDPLEESEDGDVFHAVGRAHDRQETYRPREARLRRTQNDRNSPRRKRESEGNCEPRAAQSHRTERAEEATDSDGRSQVTDLRSTSVEDAEGSDDDPTVYT